MPVIKRWLPFSSLLQMKSVFMWLLTPRRFIKGGKGDFYDFKNKPGREEEPPLKPSGRDADTGGGREQSLILGGEDTNRGKGESGSLFMCT